MRLLVLGAVLALFCPVGLIAKKNVSPHAILKEISSKHIKHKEITPQIVKRALELFVSQFDPIGIYLMPEEFRELVDISLDECSGILKELEQGQYTQFERLYQQFQLAITRSQQIRLEKPQKELSPRLSSASVSLETLRSKISEHRKKFFNRYSALLDGASWKKKVSFYNRKLSSHENKYVQNGHSDQLENLVLKAFAKSLDPHTSFYSQAEAKEMKAYLEKGFEGLGITFQERLDGIEIVGFKPRGPAHKEGSLKKGDRLVAINGIVVENLEFKEALLHLRLSPKRVELRVKRYFNREAVNSCGEKSSFKLLNISLNKEPIEVQEERLDVSYELVEGGIIGKISLHGFYESKVAKADRDIKEALRKLREKGEIKGIILDLRDNPGGLLSQASPVAGCFMKSGVVAMWRVSDEERHLLRELDGRSYYEGPLVVLTSKASASCAEIVAGALQDYGLGVVVGDAHTYGKATVQDQNATLGKDPAYRVTVGRYYTVSGRSPQITGVRADIIVPSMYHHDLIGERYLRFALSPDSSEAAFLDSLHDVPMRRKKWFQKNYVPHIQKKRSIWTHLMPSLRAASKARLAKNQSMQAFLKDPSKIPKGDPQMDEGVLILKDMICLSENSS